MFNTYKIWTPNLRAGPDNLPVQFLGYFRPNDYISKCFLFFNLNICMALIHTEMIISCIHYFFYYVYVYIYIAQNFSSVMKEKSDFDKMMTINNMMLCDDIW